MYQALYRQYRPLTFDDVLGQNHITATLKNQIVKGNVSHAYLFAGTKGTGKTSTAKIFSRAVNCLNSKDGNPCNQCENCRGILNETVMDVVEMDAASNRKIEDIRDLKDKVIYPPSQTKYKIYIIDEVHMLTNEAFNALLKTLEEPPKHLIFILATTEMEKLPQTILSRCQRFDFKRITSEEIVYNMERILNEKNLTVESRALKLIARNSDGAMRDALSLLDQCIAYKDQVSYEDALEILGIANTDLLFSLVDSIYDKDIDRLLLEIQNIVKDGKDINQFIRDLIVHFRNLLLIKASNASLELMDMDKEAFNSYKEQGEKFSIEFLLRALDLLSEAENKGKWASHPRIVVEMALISLVKLDQDLNLLERLNNLEDRLKSGTINVKKVEEPIKMTSERPKVESKIESKKEKTIEKVKPSPQLAGDKLGLEEIRNHWKDLVDRVRQEDVKLFAFLREAELYSYENQKLTLVYQQMYNFHRQAISVDENKVLCEKVFSEFLGKDISLVFLMEDQLDEKDNTEDDLKESLIDTFGEDILTIK